MGPYDGYYSLQRYYEHAESVMTFGPHVAECYAGECQHTPQLEPYTQSTAIAAGDHSSVEVNP